MAAAYPDSKRPGRRAKPLESAATAKAADFSENLNVQRLNVIVIGGSVTGLGAAMALSRLGH